MKTIYLNLWKARAEGFIVDRENWLRTYSVVKSSVKRNGEEISTIKSDKYTQPYKMLKGTRILYNVEGSYIYLDELPNLCNNREDAEIANKYVSSVKHVQQTELFVNFKWSRSKC